MFRSGVDLSKRVLHAARAGDGSPRPRGAEQGHGAAGVLSLVFATAAGLHRGHGSLRWCPSHYASVAGHGARCSRAMQRSTPIMLRRPQQPETLLRWRTPPDPAPKPFNPFSNRTCATRCPPQAESGHGASCGRPVPGEGACGPARRRLQGRLAAGELGNPDVLAARGANGVRSSGSYLGPRSIRPKQVRL